MDRPLSMVDRSMSECCDRFHLKVIEETPAGRSLDFATSHI